MKNPEKIDKISPRRKSNRVVVSPIHCLSKKKSYTKVSLSDSEQLVKKKTKSPPKKEKPFVKVKLSPKKVSPVKHRSKKPNSKKEKELEKDKLEKMKDVLENLGEFSVVERDGTLLVSLCISTEGFGHSELMVFETVTVIRITGKRYHNGKTLYFYRKVNVPHYILLSKLICMYQNGLFPSLFHMFISLLSCFIFEISNKKYIQFNLLITPLIETFCMLFISILIQKFHSNHSQFSQKLHLIPPSITHHQAQC